MNGLALSGINFINHLIQKSIHKNVIKIYRHKIIKVKILLINLIIRAIKIKIKFKKTLAIIIKNSIKK